MDQCAVAIGRWWCKSLVDRKHSKCIQNFQFVSNVCSDMMASSLGLSTWMPEHLLTQVYHRHANVSYWDVLHCLIDFHGRMMQPRMHVCNFIPSPSFPLELGSASTGPTQNNNRTRAGSVSFASGHGGEHDDKAGEAFR